MLITRKIIAKKNMSTKKMVIMPTRNEISAFAIVVLVTKRRMGPHNRRRTEETARILIRKKDEHPNG
jgi:hypothetical protein